jgi:two-component system, LytTR family, sensor histidine kinase AlgZ
MKKPIFANNRVLVMHLMFWCLYFSFFFYQITFIRHREDIDINKSLVDAIFHVFFMGLISYLNYFIFLPSFLKHKNLLKYLFQLILPFIIIVTCHIYFKWWLYDDMTGKRLQFLRTGRFVFQHIAISFFIVMFVGMLKFVEDWFSLEAKKKEIENEKLMAELRFLKAQINPHFLFNTLNNLYYLATIKSPNTTEVIEKLSQMMRYMLYDSNHNKVPFDKEIAYMENYISLEKLRLDKAIPVNFEIHGNPKTVSVVPLIFISFLENAFKHGINTNIKDSFIDVYVEVTNNSIIYNVRNSKTLKTISSEKSGIGLINVNRRLNLSYPDKYELTQTETDDIYEIKLKLILD